jgi:hypothetical protein
MLEPTTRITLNGAAGDRFLSSLPRYRAPVPRALHWLAASKEGSIEVGPEDAAVVAEFVDELISSGWVAVDAPPLLFSPRVGDMVVTRCDVLAELARGVPHALPRWQLVEAGTRGRLLGWRERAGEDPRAVVDLDGGRRLVVFVRERAVTRAPRDWHHG